MRFELAPFALPGGYGEGIVPLADVKAYLAIESSETEFDDLLPALRDAAVDMVERFCGVYLAVRTGVVWKAEEIDASSYRYGPRLRFGVGPITAITAFKYLDATGTQQTGDATTLRVSTGGDVVLKAQRAWPSDVYDGVEITFTAGYDDTTRPAALVQAVKLFVAHLFTNREAVSLSGQIAGEIPLGFRALCDAYRAVVI